MGLAEGEPIDPSQPAKLVESDCLPRLRKDDKQSVNLFTGTRPPRASARRIFSEFIIGVISKNLPRTCFLAGSVECSLAQSFCQCSPDGESTETLNPSLALFEIKWARAQIPM